MAALPMLHDVSSVPCSHAQAYLRPLSSTDAEKLTKRSLSEVAGEDEQLVKKAREISPIRDVQVLQAPVRCPACNANMASARCSRKTCKKCCLEKNAEEEKAFIESKTNGGLESEYQPLCEMHLEKVKKAQEQRDRLKAYRQAKKDKAKEIKEIEQSQREARQAGKRKGSKSKNAGLIEVEPAEEANTVVV
jgi:hypothetical protein